MEPVLSPEVVEERLKGLDLRIGSLHRRMGAEMTERAHRVEEYTKFKTEVEGSLTEIRTDVGEIKDQLKWLLRGVFGAIAVGLMFVVAVATLLFNSL